MRRARAEHPAAYASYTAEPMQKSARDFDALVAQEIARGCPPSVAGQRVVAKYGIRPEQG